MMPMLPFQRHKDVKRPEVAVTISVRTFTKLIIMVLVTIVMVLAVRRAGHALLLVFTAFFLALALNAPVNWIGQQIPGKRRGSRSLATSLAFLIAIVLLGGFLASLVPPLVHQTQGFIKTAPSLIKDFRSQDSQTGRLIRHYNLEGQVNTLSNQLSDRLKNVGGSAFSTVQKIGGSVFSLLTVLVLTFMMLVEGPGWLRFSRELLPSRRRDLADTLTTEMYRVIKGFVNGQVLLAAIASGLIAIPLFVLHISYPVALIVIVFICGLIPMVGHTIGAVIVFIVALFHSTNVAFIILAYYILYQQMENYFIQPRIQANSTNMSPLLVFVSVVIGVSFGGLFGGLVAIPAAGCIRIVLLEYLQSHKILAHDPELEREAAAATSDTK